MSQTTPEVHILPAQLERALAGIKTEEGKLRASAVAGLVAKEEGKSLISATDLAQIATNKTAIETLVGEDTGKSARSIAAEELAKQLIPENAKDSLDTLEELAAWIQAHPDDASAMNQAIEALKTLVGTIPEGVTATTVVGYVKELVDAETERAGEAEKTNADAIKKLNGDEDTEGSVANAIKAALDGVSTNLEGYVKKEDMRPATNDEIDAMLARVYGTKSE